MPDFSIAAKHPRKHCRAPQRELLGDSHRVTLSVRGATSIHATFHNVPVDLPPPPDGSSHLLSEHSDGNLA